MCTYMWIPMGFRRRHLFSGARVRGGCEQSNWNSWKCISVKVGRDLLMDDPRSSFLNDPDILSLID